MAKIAKRRTEYDEGRKAHPTLIRSPSASASEQAHFAKLHAPKDKELPKSVVAAFNARRSSFLPPSLCAYPIAVFAAPRMIPTLGNHGDL
jgi:hypothetical protein